MRHYGSLMGLLPANCFVGIQTEHIEDIDGDAYISIKLNINQIMSELIAPHYRHFHLLNLCPRNLCAGTVCPALELTITISWYQTMGSSLLYRSCPFLQEVIFLPGDVVLFPIISWPHESTPQICASHSCLRKPSVRLDVRNRYDGTS
jgi:hypothetical protein